MKKIISIMAIMYLVLVLGTANAQQVPIRGECINSTYLRTFINGTINDELLDISFPDVYCPYGCVANASQYGADCQYTPQGKQDTGYQLALIVGLAAITFILAYITFNLDKNVHGSLQIFFFGLTYWFIFATVSSIQIILEMSFVTQMFPLITVIVAAIMWGGIFFMFYIIIFLIRSMFGWIKIRKREKQEDPFGHNRRGL